MAVMGFVTELGVKDVQASINFYTGKLGATLFEQATNDEGYIIWAELGFGTSRIMLQRADLLAQELPTVADTFSKPSFVLVLRTDIKVAEDLCRALGSSAIKTGPTYTDYGTYEFSFLDPDGYVVLVAGRG